MKKLFTLLTLMLLGIGSVWAADYVVTATRTISTDKKTSEWTAIKANNGTAFQNSTTALGEGLYFVAVGKITLDGGNSLNVKANGEMYIEVPANSTGTVSFTNGANNRYMETPSGGKVHMKGDSDNSDMKASLAFTSADIVTVDEVTYLKLTSKSDCKFKSVKIVLTTGTYVILTKLDAPTIGDLTDGKVNISVPTNASSVSYTLDGTLPSASNGTIITTSTDVEITEDNVTVQAIAIGDGENYSNSAIASKVIYQPNVTCATPVITAINGTINITCATGGATVKYSIDGTNYSDFTLPKTYLTNTTVYAKAVREGATDSEVATLEVEAAPAAAAGSSSKILYYITSGNWEEMKSGSTAYGIQGKTDTDDEGWSVWISPNSSDAYDKALTSGNTTYKVNDTDDTEYTYLKGSNGRQTNIGLPDGVKANRITIYSFNNGPFDGASLWSLVGGTSYTEDTEIALQSTAGGNPDVRVFQLNDVEGTITLNNNGKVQQCFIAVVDYTIDVTKCATPTIEVGDFSFAAKGYPMTITSDNTLWISTDGENYTQHTSPYTVNVNTTTTYYAKAKGEGLEDSEVVSQEVTCAYDATKKFVAWVYTADYGVASYAFATDPMVAELQKDYNVVEVNYSADTTPSEDLKSADLIVCTEAMQGNKTMSNGMKNFVGITPMIGLKAYNYNSGRWNWGAPTNPSSTVYGFSPKSAFYKVLDGVVYESDGTIKLATKSFNDGSQKNIVQTVNFNGTDKPTDIAILGNIENNDEKAVMYVADKYFGLGLSSDCWEFYTDNALTIVKNAAAMLIADEDLSEEIATTSSKQKVKVTAAGYATFCSAYPLNFDGVANLKAYTASADNKVVSFAPATSVPAETGLLLKGVKDTETIFEVPVVANNTDVSANEFVGVLEETDLAEGSFVLMNGTQGVGFYKTGATFKAGANTAYLPASLATARTFIGFDFDDETTTGIDAALVNNGNGEVYNLQGQRVVKAQKGLYIMNGKKVLVK